VKVVADKPVILVMAVTETATIACSECGQSFDRSMFSGRVRRCRGCLRKYAIARKSKIEAHDGPITCLHCGENRDRADMFCVTSVGRGTCKKCDKAKRKQRRIARGGRHTFSYRLNKLKSSSKKRGLSVSLTIKEFRSLIDGAVCTYCGFPLPIFGAGLDRIVNSLGYSKDNCIPCCKICNVARNDNFTVDEMRRIGVVIREIQKDRESANQEAVRIAMAVPVPQDYDTVS
jgi:hypothetical protein